MFSKWCFTVNSESQNFADNLRDLFMLNKKKCLKYICGQLEVAPETGKLHFQGYLQLKRTQRLSWLKKNISSTAHWENQKALNNNDARGYCCKDDTSAGEFLEFGTYTKGPGQRNDLIPFRDAIKKGSNKRVILDEFTNEYARYPKFADIVRSLYKPEQRDWKLHQVILFVGDPGTGKTLRAYQQHPDLYEIPVSNSTLWFDGYDQHQAVLFDDFGGKMSKMTLDNSLKLFDVYVRQIPIKGGHVWWNPEIVYVTSNFHPRYWYDFDNREISYNALKRRFTLIIVFEKGLEPYQTDVDQYFEDRELWPEINVISYREDNN